MCQGVLQPPVLGVKAVGEKLPAWGWLFQSMDMFTCSARLTAPLLHPSNPSLCTPLELDQLWAVDTFPIAQQPEARRDSRFL